MFIDVLGIPKKPEKTKKDKNKEVSFSLMMSLILLDELLKVNFQDSSNKIKPSFIIKQTRGQSSVRTSFRIFGDFRILSEYERDII